MATSGQVWTGRCGRGGVGGGHTPGVPPGGGAGSSGQAPGRVEGTTLKGYRNLLAWAKGFGPVRCAGVEGTSGYGALSWLAT
jgi:hypothetical protein